MKGYDAIYRIALLIMKDISLREKLQTISEILAITLKIERCAIALIQENDETYVYCAGVVRNGGPPHELGRIRPLTDCPPIAEVVGSGKLYLIENAPKNPAADYMRPLVERAEMKSVLFVPVITKGEVEMIIVLDAVCQKQSFSKEEDVDFVCRVAEIIAQIREHERLAKYKVGLEAVNLVNTVLKHELRNPMAASFGFLQKAYKRANDLRESGRLDDKTLVKWLRVSLEEAQRIETTTNNMFSFLSNHTALKREEVDLRAFIKGVLEAPSIVSQNQVIKIDLKCENVPPVSIDREKIRNAFINLLQNALEYLKNHDNIPEKIIRIEVKKLKRSIKVAISNPGHIDNPDNVFEPFYTSTPDKLGLGLTVAKAIVEIHDATIRCRQRDDWVEFTIYFPF